MKRFVFSLIILTLMISAFCVPVEGQLWPGSASRVLTRPTLPATCEPRNGQIIYLQNGNRGIYACTELNTWTRIDTSGVYNVQAFGAIGNGIVNDYAAIMAAHTALPATGGTMLFPPGDYAIATTLVFTKKVHLMGVAVVSPDDAVNTPATITKLAALNGYAVVLSGMGSTMEGITVDAAPGSGGSGIRILANSVELTRVSVFDQPADGIVIGDPGSAANCNSWSLRRIRSRGNAGNGLSVSSNNGAAANANVGLVIDSYFGANGADGVYLNNVYFATLVGNLFEGNTGWGLNATVNCNELVLIGGDSEGNGGGQLNTTLCPNARILFPAEAVVAGFEVVPGDVIPLVLKHNYVGGVGSSTIALGGSDNIGTFGSGLKAAYDRSISLFSTVSLQPTNGAGARVDALSVTVVGTTLSGVLTFTGTTFGILGVPADGTIIYCSDCTVASPCAAAGTGALAKRLNGAWICN